MIATDAVSTSLDALVVVASALAEASSIKDLMQAVVDLARHGGLAGGFALLQGMGADGAIVGVGRIGSPLVEPRYIPAAAWDHLALDSSSPFAWTLRTPEGVRIYDVEIRQRWGDPGESVDGELGATAERSRLIGISAGNAKLAEPVTNALEAVGRLLVERDAPVSLAEFREAFAAFGLDLSDDGAIVLNSPSKVDGEAKTGTAGRRPTVTAVLINAMARRLLETRPVETVLSATAFAREILDRVEPLAPHLVFPSAKSAARNCGALVERSQAKKPVGNNWREIA